MARKLPKQTDVIVGGNVRRMRLARRLSQEKLADGLNLTFQQVQKYEKGTNRIGSSRLAEIAVVLGCTIDDLFEGVTVAKGNGKKVQPSVEALRKLSLTQRGHRLAELWALMSPREQQAAVEHYEVFLVGRE